MTSKITPISTNAAWDSSWYKTSRMEQAIYSFSEERKVDLLVEKPDAYVEWGGPSNFNIDSFAEDERKERGYILSGDYYEEAREYKDEFRAQGPEPTNYFARTLKSIAFRGKLGEQVIMKFAPAQYEVSSPNKYGAEPFSYKMIVDAEGKFNRIKVREGDPVPDQGLPHETPLQWFRFFTDSKILDI